MLGKFETPWEKRQRISRRDNLIICCVLSSAAGFVGGAFFMCLVWSNQL